MQIHLNDEITGVKDHVRFYHFFRTYVNPFTTLVSKEFNRFHFITSPLSLTFVYINVGLFHLRLTIALLYWIKIFGLFLGLDGFQGIF